MGTETNNGIPGDGDKAKSETKLPEYVYFTTLDQKQNSLRVIM